MEREEERAQAEATESHMDADAEEGGSSHFQRLGVLATAGCCFCKSSDLLVGCQNAALVDEFEMSEDGGATHRTLRQEATGGQKRAEVSPGSALCLALLVCLCAVVLSAHGCLTLLTLSWHAWQTHTCLHGSSTMSLMALMHTTQSCWEEGSWPASAAASASAAAAATSTAAAAALAADGSGGRATAVCKSYSSSIS